MNGGYSNGYTDSSVDTYGSGGGYNTLAGNSRERAEDSRSRERRPGRFAGSYEQTPSPARQDGRGADLERRKAHRVSRERRLSRGRSESGARERRASQQIEDVLAYIKKDWNFMTEDTCVPVQTALQLLDTSSLGLAHRYDTFQEAQTRLQDALRGIVNEHHQGFNSSIGTFHQIQASIQSSHQRIRMLKQSLADAKKNLTTTKSEFTALVNSSRNCEGMIDVLSTIEQIQLIPAQLESRISEKRFLSAVDALQDGLRLTRDSQLENIGALNDMKVYISNQEHSLTDILIEELHNHLYLKSPYCENRWTAYAKLHRQNGDTDGIDSGARELYEFLDDLDTTEPLQEDPSRNPEAASFHYIYVIVESLSKMNRLDEAVDAIEHRLPVELFKVAEKSNEEVQQRHTNVGRANWAQAKDPLDIILDNATRSNILNDLLGTLYAKFEAIAESYRAFHEVIAGISKRKDSNTAHLTRSFRELWKLYQSELRSLLHDYLSTDGSSAHRLGQMGGEENVFRQQRDRAKKCTFKMDWVDPNDPEIKPEREEVITLWQKFVPGLVSLPSNSNGSHATSANGNIDSSGTGHKLLVEPSVFNITSLLPPSVIFLKRLRSLVPPNSDIVVSTLSSFLNDFLINVFHPQLEETLEDFCSQNFIQMDAFQEDPQWAQYSSRPIFKGTSTFLEIIEAFSKMLSGLTHDQLFSQLVITQMNNYYDKCRNWYRVLSMRAKVRSDGRTLKAAPYLAEGGDISNIASRIWERGQQDTQALVEQESALLISSLAGSQLEDLDLLGDRRPLVSLCLLYTSMNWLGAKLKQLRRVSPRATDTTGMEDSEDKPQLKRSLTAALESDQSIQEDSPIYLPLSEGTASLFDGIVNGFEELADTALLTLHLELRCQVIQGLSESFRGSLIYADVADAPDENVMRLVTDLLEFNREIAAHLSAQEYKYITTGTSYLADSILVHSTVQSVTGMNSLGSAHLQLNTHVLYHNLLNLEPNGDFSRSFAFIRLFDQGPDAIVAAAKGESSESSKFTRRECEALLKLWYSETLGSENKEEATNAKKALEGHIAALR